MSKTRASARQAPAKAMPASPKPINATVPTFVMTARLAVAAPGPQIRIRMTLFDSPKSVGFGEVAEQGDEVLLRGRGPPVGAGGKADRPPRLLDRIADRDQVALAADLVRRQQGQEIA